MNFESVAKNWSVNTVLRLSVSINGETDDSEDTWKYVDFFSLFV